MDLCQQASWVRRSERYGVSPDLLFPLHLAVDVYDCALDTSSTCSMLPREKDGVVDNHLKVKVPHVLSRNLVLIHIFRSTALRTFVLLTCLLYLSTSLVTRKVGKFMSHVRP